MPVAEVDYVEQAGPGIPELPDAPPSDALPAGQPVAPIYPGWEQGTVEQFLRGTGAGIHMLIGASERDWLMTEKDLERIAPPLTRICNRWEPALRLSPIADPLLVAHGFALYGWRSALERQRALRDQALEHEDLAGAGPRYEPAGADVDVDGGAPDLEDLEAEPYFDRNGGTTNDG
jgi:hypothetical protein